MNWELDDNGLPLHLGDGGDCCARSGELITGFKNTDLFVHEEWIWSALEPKRDGILIRYTKPPYNNPFDKEWGTSRDQVRPHIAAAGFAKNPSIIKRIMWATVKNFFRCPNGDFCGPDFYGDCVRALRLSSSGFYLLFFPLLACSDVIGLVNSIISLVKQNIHPDTWVGETILHTQVLILSANSIPTPISWLARKIFSWVPAFEFNGGDFRAKANYKKRSGYNGVQWCFDHYHREGNPFNELYRPIISKWF